MNTYIALKLKTEFSFCCVSRTETHFAMKVTNAYWNWHSAQSKSADPETKTKETFLLKYDKVKITLEFIS